MNTIPQNLRMQDLIAKTARVTLLDTIRVLLALKAVSHAYAGELFTPIDFVGPLSPTRPTPENVAACEQAFFALREGDMMECREDIDIALRNLQRFL